MSTDPYAPNPQAGAPTLGPFNMNRIGRHGQPDSRLARAGQSDDAGQQLRRRTPERSFVHGADVVIGPMQRSLRCVMRLAARVDQSTLARAAASRPAG